MLSTLPPGGRLRQGRKGEGLRSRRLQGAALRSADWDPLRGRADITIGRTHIGEAERLVQELQPYEVVVAMRERTLLPRDVLQRLPNLRLIVSTGPYNAAIDVEAARELGITVCGTRGLGTPTLELTWALILACVKGIPANDRALREGDWQTAVRGDLAGRRLGVVGLGRLGSGVATVAKAFGMDVCAWSPNLTDDRCREVGVQRTTLEELLSTSDVVTLHLVLSERTRSLLGAAELARMKPTAHLVNTSRGGLLDEPALVAALSKGTIASAGLDVFTEEPLPAASPLRRLANVVLSPHMGYVTEASYAVFFSDVVQDIHAYLDGHVLRPIRPTP
jgi:phosphoglycerate dehydrogenase-like enzyme